MIDHVSVSVQDFPRAIAFYKGALSPLGYQLLMEFPDAAGFGAKGKADLWLMRSDKPLHPMHIALSAARDVVNAFHAAGLASGGADNGAPGLRPDYHPNYYAAYVLDPDGNNIEVVCHEPPHAAKARAAKPRAAARKKAPAKRPPARKAPAKKRPAKKRR